MTIRNTGFISARKIVKVRTDLLTVQLPVQAVASEKACYLLRSCSHS